MFQERELLIEHGHTVIDFSMQDDRNFSSTYFDYFIGKQDYRSSGLSGKLKSMLTFVHSSEAVHKIGALIDRTKPDLVHCHNIYHQLTPSIIGAAKRRGVPVALTLHDYKPVCPVYNRLRHGTPCSLCLDGNFRHVLSNRCADHSLLKSAMMYAEAVVQRQLGSYENVDAYIAPSQFMAEAISHRIPKERVHLLYNGIDTSSVQVSNSDEGYALYLGRLSAEKGVETLLKAHAAASGQWPLVVAGTGPLEAGLKLKYQQAEFVGHVTGDRLKAVIEGAAVLVIPSEWYENCPMSVLEAMSYGKPVIGSRMGGIPELVVDGVTGLLFKAGDAYDLEACLNKLMSDVGLRRRLGTQARQRVESEFSLKRHNTCLMDIYKTLLGV